MSGSSLLVIVDDDVARDDKAAEVEAALGPWAEADRPAMRTVSAARVMGDASALDAAAAAAAWVHLERGGGRVEHELLALLAERKLPALLTRGDETAEAGSEAEAGVTVCPPRTSPTLACAMLRTLWGQSALVSELRTEVRALESQQKELGNQIGRVDEELRLAAQLQREFLPTTLPQVDDLAFRVFFRPASYVSGDIYDVVKLDEHHIGLFIADAVGHGVPAALLTMYIKRSLRTKAVDRKLPGGYRLIEPAEALATLNRDLVNQQTEQVRFATACYAVIDCRTRRATMARAGHPPAVLLRQDGRTEHLEPEGSLLGIFPDEVFEQVEFELAPQDRLLLYSDGFETAFPDPDAKGSKIASDQYWQEFEELRRSGLDAALARLGERLDHQIGSLNQRDDLTMLCVAATGEPIAEAEREEQIVEEAQGAAVVK